ncbi:MAG: hypothetical protein LQ343_007771 [Gyalolechia ehrenbergii]|nr:MAG: hypothetical protein LQ343_007771 [Gyalolechia ehrenbergii]
MDPNKYDTASPQRLPLPGQLILNAEDLGSEEYTIAKAVLNELWAKLGRPGSCEENDIHERNVVISYGPVRLALRVLRRIAALGIGQGGKGVGTVYHHLCDRVQDRIEWVSSTIPDTYTYGTQLTSIQLDSQPCIQRYLRNLVRNKDAFTLTVEFVRHEQHSMAIQEKSIGGRQKNVWGQETLRAMLNHWKLVLLTYDPDRCSAIITSREIRAAIKSIEHRIEDDNAT